MLKRRMSGTTMTQTNGIVRMALARDRRSDRGFDYWPGFVDALSTLILGIIFLLSVFVVVQFFLSQEITRQGPGARPPQRADFAAHRTSVAGEDPARSHWRSTISQLRASLRHRRRRARPRARRLTRGLAGAGADAGADAAELGKALDSEKAGVVARAGAGRSAQPADRGAAPPARRAGRRARRLGEARPANPQARVADLGSAAECSAGAARAGTVALPLGFLRPPARHSRQPPGHPHRRRPLRVPVGSVLRHRPGGAAYPRARPSSTSSPRALLELEQRIPQEVAWVLRVDGHTDVRPIRSPQFPSNWELSARARDLGRAISDRRKGVSPQRLVAAGFGEFQPLDTGADAKTPIAATAASS